MIFFSDVLEKGDIYHDLHMSGCVWPLLLPHLPMNPLIDLTEE